MPPLTGLHYAGGKAARSPNRVGTWITSLLPYKTTYVEPFAGMLGVLLQRKPSIFEIVSDTNQHLINWWRMVRNHPDELGRLCDRTPWSRAEHETAYHTVTSPVGDTLTEQLEAARAVTIQLMQSLYARLGESHWQYNYRDTGWSVDRFTRKYAGLATRLRKVRLETWDCVRMINEHKTDPDTVIYCDPPYPDVTSGFLVPFDPDAFMAELTTDDVQAAIAVSGYSDAWPQLDAVGWRKETRDIKQMMGDMIIRGETARKTETLWCNFDASQRQYTLL